MKKINGLKSILKEMGSVVVAYSGGLDSTFLLKMAISVLGKDKVLAVTARSETYPVSEYRESQRLASSVGARYFTIKTDELKDSRFISNPVDRCYYCKSELFSKLDKIRRKNEFSFVADGTNVDDLKDIRHGRKAAGEHGVRSPLLEAGITKNDIRKHSRRLGLDTWDKPSFACLASRVPFDTKIAKEDLARVDKAESYLRSLGFKQVRVRLHGDIARLEFYRGDFRLILNDKVGALVVRKIKSLGFRYICVDIEGYRTGSMHEVNGKW